MSKKLFGGARSEEYQAIYDAIQQCGQENSASDLPDDAPPTDKTYEWLEETPRCSLMCELVNKLHEMGFKIIDSEQTEDDLVDLCEDNEVMKEAIREYFVDPYDNDELPVDTDGCLVNNDGDAETDMENRS